MNSSDCSRRRCAIRTAFRKPWRGCTRSSARRTRASSAARIHTGRMRFTLQAPEFMRPATTTVRRTGSRRRSGCRCGDAARPWLPRWRSAQDAGHGSARSGQPARCGRGAGPTNWRADGGNADILDAARSGTWNWRKAAFTGCPGRRGLVPGRRLRLTRGCNHGLRRTPCP